MVPKIKLKMPPVRWSALALHRLARIEKIRKITILFRKKNKKIALSAIKRQNQYQNNRLGGLKIVKLSLFRVLNSIQWHQLGGISVRIPFLVALPTVHGFFAVENHLIDFIKRFFECQREEKGEGVGGEDGFNCVTHLEKLNVI